MSELEGTRFDLDEARIDSNDATSAEPGTGIKDDGQPEGSFPPAQHHNYLFRRYWLALRNLFAVAPREFDTLAEAIDAIVTDPNSTGDGERFSVRSDGAGGGAIVPPFNLLQSINFGVGNTILDVVSDGQAIYALYIVGGKITVERRSSFGGALGAWAGGAIGYGGNTSTAGTLESDGSYLYAANDSDTSLFVIDPTDGSIVNTIVLASGINPFAIAANGTHAVVIDGASGKLDIIATPGGTPGITSKTIANVTILKGVALDATTAYVAHAAASDDEAVITAFRLSDGAELWQRSQYGKNAQATVGYDVVVDDEFIHLLSDVGVFCLRKLDGVAVWLTPFTTGTARMVGDDRWLYYQSTGDATGVLDRRSGALVGVIIDVLPRAADGYSLHGMHASLTTSVFQHYVQGATQKEYMMAAPAEANRSPFYRLAIPTAGREAMNNDPFFAEGWLTSEVNFAPTASATFAPYFANAAVNNSPLTFRVLGGVYEIWWSFMAHFSGNGWGGFDATLDGASVFAAGEEYEVGALVGGTTGVPLSGRKILTLSSGQHTLDIRLRQGASPGTPTIRRGAVGFRRVG